MVVKGLLVAAVNFDAQTDAVVKTAAAFARKFGMDVRFVSVVEPVLYDLYGMDMPIYPAFPPINLVAEAALVEDREKSMRSLLAGLKDQGFRMSGSVMVGGVVPMLVAEAMAKRANLIVTAYNPEGYRTVASGFSTVLGLMHEAPLPVLAVASGAVPDVGAPGFKLLLADDLQQSSREAAAKTYELAAQLPGSHVRHVHVHGDLRELLRDTWREAAHKKEFEAQQVQAFNARVEALHKNADPYRVAAEKAGARVELDVRTGKVGDELHAAVEDAEPDLIVFGRHRLLRARPFLVGRMPFRAMLQERRPVLLVPGGDELYARLPFPAAH